MGIEPTFESWETCAASRRHKSARSPRNKALEKAGKQSAVDEAEFRRKVKRSDSNWLQLEPGGSCNVIIRRELGVYGLSSTPTRFRHIFLI
jgi:hypothetical protein